MSPVRPTFEIARQVSSCSCPVNSPIRSRRHEGLHRPGVLGVPSETFLRVHAERLPADVTVIHGLLPHIGDGPLLPRSLVRRACHKISRALAGRDWSWELTRAYIEAFRRCRADVVLAEYGLVGVRVMEACRRAGVPLVVHFHGYDASMRSVLEEHVDTYPRLFQEAAAIIAVSREMERRLVSFGAPPGKVHYNSYGVDCETFGRADPERAAAVFLAVGRFVEKKAPHLTLLAFAELHRDCPEACLRMIGDGPLLAVCKDLVRGLGLSDAVTFLGVQPPGVVREEMRLARGFVQHSVEAANGDCEGTPVAILEGGSQWSPRGGNASCRDPRCRQRW